MQPLIDQLRTWHEFLARRSFYALVLISVFACAILAGRVIMSRSWGYVFLVWNLILAWAPYFWILWAASIHRRHPQDWWRLLAPGALWLLFLPNAPYIVTDFVHLRYNTSFLWWYDLGLIGMFAWAGCFLAVASLSIAQDLTEGFVGRWGGWLLAIAASGLSGLGIYLGRFLRWNSWDMLVRPDAVLADIIGHLADPLSNPRTYGVTLLFAAFLFVCHVTFFGARGARMADLAPDSVSRGAGSLQ